jgi:DNA modification methylase
VKPYYEQSGVTIYHGDCRDVAPTLAMFDAVITSPPYNLGASPWPHLGHWKPGDSAGGRSKWKNGSDAGAGIQYAEHQDAMPWAEYVEWQRDILTMLAAKAPVVFYNHKPRVIGGRLWTPLELIPDTVTLRQIVIWARPGGLNFNQTAFVPTHEWVMVLAREEWRLKSKGASGLGDVWEMAPERNPHPAPFPEALPSRALDASGAMSVLDPFSGSGTTLVAAKRLGRKAVGIEVSERYCEMAAHRLSQATLPMFASEVQLTQATSLL